MLGGLIRLGVGGGMDLCVRMFKVGALVLCVCGGVPFVSFAAGTRRTQLSPPQLLGLKT